MRTLVIPMLMLSAFAFLSAGCGEKTSIPAPTAASADEVVLSVPGMT